jgi:hypothetical protein
MRIEKLVAKFKDHVKKQNMFILKGDTSKGNNSAKEYIGAFNDLVSQYGDGGREALSKLLEDDDIGVKEMAATFLLKYKTNISLEVLTEIASGTDFIAFGAKQAIKNWHSGAWSLDR